MFILFALTFFTAWGVFRLVERVVGKTPHVDPAMLAAVFTVFIFLVFMLIT